MSVDTATAAGARQVRASTIAKRVCNVNNVIIEIGGPLVGDEGSRERAESGGPGDQEVGDCVLSPQSRLG
jgi:hypothetical protein